MEVNKSLYPSISCVRRPGQRGGCQRHQLVVSPVCAREIARLTSVAGMFLPKNPRCSLCRQSLTFLASGSLASGSAAIRQDREVNLSPRVMICASNRSTSNSPSSFSSAASGSLGSSTFFLLDLGLAADFFETGSSTASASSSSSTVSLL